MCFISIVSLIEWNMRLDTDLYYRSLSWYIKWLMDRQFLSCFSPASTQTNTHSQTAHYAG